ncbi:membrane-associated protein, putative [Bodo saltans]|uniref:Membrane-associated protein, putative n=1 Tax=Bodo saltans TaxID=75058 RepID=A0A0S4JA25_BODSA|nr:membrane-associated protein, putative [Bodo saltans]|eukprot:CUG87054.1 membrane-associated protein, putative [Bodo saltans]
MMTNQSSSLSLKARIVTCMIVVMTFLSLCANAQTLSTVWRRDASSSTPYRMDSISTSKFIGTDNIVYFVSNTGNRSAGFVDVVTGTITRLVKNNGTSSCSPFLGTVPDFSASYPITPLAVAVSGNGKQMFIGDSVPSARIFSITTTSSRTFLPASTNSYSRFAGGECSYIPGTLGNGVPKYSDMNSANYIAFDSRTGNLYLTQSRAVFQISAADNNAYYYLGNQQQAGDRTTEPYTPINRLLARTSQPNQIFIDEVGDTMYVAENGMGTVRQIQMTTGNASVVIGQFLSYTWPPASCPPSNPCTADNVTFSGLTSVALYRAQSVNQRWLFIGDLTEAVIYKMILETGVVTVVAGQMLNSGTIDGAASVSRLSVIKCIAIGFSSIYVADGSLRRLELNDNPTPAPPVIAPAVLDQTSNAVVGATLALGIVNPTGATQASRANVIMALARCERQFGQLPAYTHLLQFSVGDDPDFQYFVGAVIGNIVICLGTLLLNALMVFGYAKYTNQPASSAASSLKFPSLVSLPLLFVLNPTISVGVSLMAYASGWMIGIGVLGFLASLIGFGIVTVYFVFFFEGHSDFEMLDKKFSGVFARMVNPVGEWLQTDLTGRMGMFFEDYLPSCWWFVILELGMCVLSGIIEGIRPADEANCLIAIGLASVLYTAFFVALVLWQPYTVRFVYYLRALIAGLQMVSAFLSLAAVKTSDPDWEAAGISFGLASLYATTIDALFALFITIRDLYDFFHAQGGGGIHEAGVPLRVMDRQNSDTGSNDSIVLEKLGVSHEPADERASSFDEERGVGGVSRHAILREHISELISHGELADSRRTGGGGAVGAHNISNLRADPMGNSGNSGLNAADYFRNPRAADQTSDRSTPARHHNPAAGVFQAPDSDNDSDAPPPPPLPNASMISAASRTSLTNNSFMHRQQQQQSSQQHGQLRNRSLTNRSMTKAPTPPNDSDSDSLDL